MLATAQEIREPYPKASQDVLFDTLTRFAQDIPLLALARLPLLESEAQRDRILFLGFTSALIRQRDVAALYLPSVIDRPWIAGISFPNACALAHMLDAESPAAENLLWAIARKNPDVALRNVELFQDLAFGARLLDRVVGSAPDEALSLASGVSRAAVRFREALRASQDPAIRLLADLSEDHTIDAPRLRRAAILHRRIARGDLPLRSAIQIAGNFPKYFSTLADMRLAAPPGESDFLDRALEAEALLFCQAFLQSGGRGLTSDLASLPPRDVYLLLAYGRAEANEPIFNAALPRLRSAQGASMRAILNRTKNLKLREFVAASIAVRRLEAFLQLAGADVMARLALGIDQAEDRLQAAVTVAEVIDGASGHAGVDQLAAAIAAEYARCREKGDRQSEALYGLLAARMVQANSGAPAMAEIAGRYLPYMTAAGTFEMATLFGEDGYSVQRHFFYDDEDGVESFTSFKSGYARDPAWTIQDRGDYLEIEGAGNGGEGSGGRRIRIFANVPIDARLPVNAGRGDEALRRQQAISDVLAERGLVPNVLVHRGHSFHVAKTIRFVTSAAKLVFLGSCGGVAEVHSVIERSRDAQVIATRGIGTTALNDAILKSLNDWLLRGDRAIEWAGFWQAQKSQLGRNPMFRDYFAPHQDTASILMRAYFQFAD